MGVAGVCVCGGGGGGVPPCLLPFSADDDVLKVTADLIT